MCPLTPTNFNPREPLLPADLYHSTPRAKICGTFANVSTLLITVGFCHNPICTREWRLVPRLRAMSFNRLNQRAFFAANVAAGTDKNFQIEIPGPLPRIFLSEQAPLDSTRRISSPRISSCK